MKKLHYILIPSAILIITTIFAACSRKDNSDEGRKSRGQQQVLSHETDIEETPSPLPAPQAAGYLVRLENKTLTLYELSESEPSVIKTVNIDTSYYPFDDIQELNKGIFAYSKEGGYEILENFIN